MTITDPGNICQGDFVARMGLFTCYIPLGLVEGNGSISYSARSTQEKLNGFVFSPY